MPASHPSSSLTARPTRVTPTAAKDTDSTPNSVAGARGAGRAVSIAFHDSPISLYQATTVTSARPQRSLRPRRSNRFFVP
jgi:hypothetical protein